MNNTTNPFPNEIVGEILSRIPDRKDIRLANSRLNRLSNAYYDPSIDDNYAPPGRVDTRLRLGTMKELID
jgi:hypothetical protein